MIEIVADPPVVTERSIAVTVIVTVCSSVACATAAVALRVSAATPAAAASLVLLIECSLFACRVRVSRDASAARGPGAG
jgi:hypothetical protein